MRAAYWTVTEFSNVVRMGMPSEFTITIPITPLCELMRLRVSSTSDCGVTSAEPCGRRTQG